MGEMRNAYKFLTGKPKGKRLLGRTRRRWEDIRMDLTQIEFEVVDSIHLALNRVQWLVLVKTQKVGHTLTR
jgi:hypothetical protein